MQTIEALNGYPRQEPTAKVELITQYQPLVRRIAYRFVRRGVGAMYCLDPADFISWGNTGLIEALSEFNPQTGVSLARFAKPYIREAIDDAIRRNAMSRVGMEEEFRAITEAEQTFEQQTGRAATNQDVAKILGIRPSTVFKVNRGWRLKVVSIQQYDEPDFPDELSANPADIVAEKEAAQQLMDALHEAIQRLPARLRVVLELRYYRGLKMDQVAKVLSISPTSKWVSKLHTQALGLLRQSLIEILGYEPETLPNWILVENHTSK